VALQALGLEPACWRWDSHCTHSIHLNHLASLGYEPWAALIRAFPLTIPPVAKECIPEDYDQQPPNRREFSKEPQTSLTSDQKYLNAAGCYIGWQKSVPPEDLPSMLYFGSPYILVRRPGKLGRGTSHSP
jgi:hypothetical protein